MLKAFATMNICIVFFILSRVGSSLRLNEMPPKTHGKAVDAVKIPKPIEVARQKLKDAGLEITVENLKK